MLRFFNRKKPQPEQKGEKKLSRPIVVQRDSINETYAALSISQIKRILHEEEFSSLNSLYFLMLQRDLHLSSEINKRKMQLLTTEYMIEGNDKAKKFCEEFIKSFRFSGLIHELSSAIPYGFSFIDLTWDVKDIDGKSAFVPISYKQLSQRFIYSDNEEQKYLKDTIEHLYIKHNENKQFIVDFDKRKMLTHIHKTDTGFITDFVLLNKVVWFVALKHAVIAANMQYYDALGTPPLIIHFDSDDEKELDFLLSQALSLRSNGVGIFPQDSTASLLEGKGSKSDFLSFISYIDGAISQYVLGNTLAGGDASKGTYGTAKIHAEIKKEYLLFDASMVAETLTNFFNIVLSQNFPSEKISFSFVIEDDEGQKELSETYKNITQMGFTIPPEHIEKKFNIPGVKRGSSPTQAQQNHRIEKNRKAKPIDRIDKALQDLNTKKEEEEIVKAIEQLLSKSETYEEALSSIIKNYPEMKLEKIEEIFSAIIANSMMLGDFDASQD